MLGLYLALAKYNQLLYKEIENTRNTQGHKVAYNDIPAIDMLKKKQEKHLDGKSRQGGNIEYYKVFEKTFDTLVLYPVVPYKEIGTKEVANDSKLKGNNRR